jgi:hypothetical protein
MFRCGKYFQRAIHRARGVAYPSPIFTARHDSIFRTALAAPVFKEEQLVGGIASSISFRGALGVVQDPGESYAAVSIGPEEGTNPREFLIFNHPGQGQAAKLERFLPPPDLTHYGDPVALHNPAFAGRWLAGMTNIPGTDWSVLVQRRYSTTVAPMHTLLLKLGLAAALVLSLELLAFGWILWLRLPSRVK